MAWNSWKAPAPVVPSTPIPVASTSSVLVSLINVERAKQGIPPVVADTGLTAIAASQAAKNAADGKPSSDGFLERTKAYSHRAEITMQSADAASAIDSWMSSPPNRAIILDPLMKRAGGWQVGGFRCIDFAESEPSK